MRKELLKFKYGTVFVSTKQAQQDIAKKEADLLRPILEKAKAAIEKVSRAQIRLCTRCISR